MTARSTQHAARSTQHAARSTQHAARSTQLALGVLWLLVLTSVAATLSCNPAEHDQPVQTAATSEAIRNGDDAPAHGEVFKLNIVLTDGDTASCSGVLITPVHVLTSAHCFRKVLTWLGTTRAAASPTAVVTLTNDPLGTFSVPPLASNPPGSSPFTVTHTPGVAPGTNPPVLDPNHVVKTWTQLSPMDEISNGFANQDLAIVPLDMRVPVARVTPAKLPFQAYKPPNLGLDDCEESFSGEYVGYGTGAPLWDLTAQPNPGTRKRGTHTLVRSDGHYDGEFPLGSQVLDFIPGSAA